MIFCNNRQQDNNTTDIPGCLYICPLIIGSPALSTKFSRLCGKRSVAVVYSSSLRRCKKAVISPLVSPADSNLCADILPHVHTTTNHIGRDLECRKDVPSPPSPNVAPHFVYHD